jgi:small nuclear ribonucleoprotein (snRNP)-like protein
MPNHDEAYYVGLDRKYNGSLYDYDESLNGHITTVREKIHIRYCADGKHWLKRLVDITEIVCIVGAVHKFNI